MLEIMVSDYIKAMLSVAVIGFGWWGKTIAGLLKGHAQIKVVHIVDPLLENSISFDKAVSDPSVQAVILCTPHSLHVDQIVTAAAAGKHVFCEKPLALTRADALRAVEACRRANVVLGIGHERRFEPPVLELRRLAADGVLGTLLQIEANFSQDKFLALPADNWRLQNKDAPAGPMTATGIHLLDLSVSLLGPAERAFCSVRTLGSQLTNGDTLAALVQFRSGAHALLTAVLATPFDGRFAVYGNKGWAEVRDKAHPEAPEGWTLTTCMQGGKAKTVDYPPSAAVRSNLEAFARAVSGAAPYPVPHEQMVANISALEAIFRSARSGKVEVVEG